MAKLVKITHHLQALCGIFVAAPQHQQLERFAAVAFYRLCINTVINHHAVDRDTIARNKFVCGDNHGAAFCYRVLFHDLVVAELLIDQNRRGIG
ncbi:hypothetical protein D3C78_642340 [compost metagenome]